MGLTADEKRQALEYTANNADFMIIPTASLRENIKDNHPKTKNINWVIKIFLQRGDAVRQDPELVKKYCLGTIDEDNKWLYDQCDIKVEPKPIILNIKENKNE